MSTLTPERPHRLPLDWRLSMRRFLIFWVALPFTVLGVLFKAFNRLVPLSDEHGSQYLKVAAAFFLAALLVALVGFALTYFDPNKRRPAGRY